VAQLDFETLIPIEPNKDVETIFSELSDTANKNSDCDKYSGDINTTDFVGVYQPDQVFLEIGNNTNDILNKRFKELDFRECEAIRVNVPDPTAGKIHQIDITFDTTFETFDCDLRVAIETELQLNPDTLYAIQNYNLTDSEYRIDIQETDGPEVSEYHITEIGHPPASYELSYPSIQQAVEGLQNILQDRPWRNDYEIIKITRRASGAGFTQGRRRLTRRCVTATVVCYPDLPAPLPQTHWLFYGWAAN